MINKDKYFDLICGQCQNLATNVESILNRTSIEQHRPIGISRRCLKCPRLRLVHVSLRFTVVPFGAHALGACSARLKSTGLPQDIDTQSAEQEPFLSGHPILPEDMGVDLCGVSNSMAYIFKFTFRHRRSDAGTAL